MDYEWLTRRLDVDEEVFGPPQELLLTAEQRRALIQLYEADAHAAWLMPSHGSNMLFRGIPVRVPRGGGAHLGAVGGE